LIELPDKDFSDFLFIKKRVGELSDFAGEL